MSAAEHQSPNMSSNSAEQGLRRPPKRHSLLKPPHRRSSDAPEKTPEPEPLPAPPSPASDTPPIVSQPSASVVSTPEPPLPTLHPISPPSEPMQYRAIGLVRGTYTPSEGMLNRGELMTDDGAAVDTVLLGRVTSLIKKHIDLSMSHLWVVYPRTRQVNEDQEEDANAEVDLHLQIVGVWEPETLGLPGESPKADDDSPSDADITEMPDLDPGAPESSPAATPETTAELKSADVESADVAQPETLAADETITEAEAVVPAESSETVLSSESLEASSPVVELPSENYFSIRGEVLKYDEDTKQILVKIVQRAKRLEKTERAFRVHVAGEISGKTVGYFWELNVERQGKQLILVDGSVVAIVPPKKKKKKKFGGGKRMSSQGPRRKSAAPPPKTKPRIKPTAPVKSNPL